MKKRLLSFLLIFCMMLSVLPTNILAVGQQDADEAVRILTGAGYGCFVCGYVDEGEKDVVIQ